MATAPGVAPGADVPATGDGLGSATLAANLGDFGQLGVTGSADIGDWAMEAQQWTATATDTGKGDASWGASATGNQW